jgi:hypothetical protein
MGKKYKEEEAKLEKFQTWKVQVMRDEVFYEQSKSRLLRELSALSLEVRRIQEELPALEQQAAAGIKWAEEEDLKANQAIRQMIPPSSKGQRQRWQAKMEALRADARRAREKVRQLQKEKEVAEQNLLAAQGRLSTLKGQWNQVLQKLEDLEFCRLGGQLEEEKILRAKLDAISREAENAIGRLAEESKNPRGLESLTLDLRKVFDTGVPFYHKR